jgi:predicted nucleic acid-binding protein
MKSRERKYALDTNVFVDALRDASINARLIQFHSEFAPFEYLHAVVVQELQAGVKTGRSLRFLDKYLLAPFLRRGRLITPSFPAWKQSGDVLREFALRHGMDLQRMRKSFGNDILLAISCREAGVTLVTNNLRDFGHIHSVCPFEYCRPWPTR